MTVELLVAIAQLCLMPNGYDGYLAITRTHQAQLACQKYYIICLNNGKPLSTCVLQKTGD